LQDLHEGDYHDDGKDEDADRFKTAPTDWELLSERLQTPTDELVGRPDDYRAE
jgi:hypothetical protein